VFWTLAAFVWARWGCMWGVSPRFSTFRSCTPQRSFWQWQRPYAPALIFAYFRDKDVKYYFFFVDPLYSDHPHLECTGTCTCALVARVPPYPYCVHYISSAVYH
jgi:hypothetical protein